MRKRRVFFSKRVGGKKRSIYLSFEMSPVKGGFLPFNRFIVSFNREKEAGLVYKRLFPQVFITISILARG